MYIISLRTVHAFLTVLLLVIATTVTAPVCAVAATHSVESVPNVHVADRTRYVSNPDGVISPATESRLNTLLAGAWQSTTAEPVIVVLEDIDSDDPDAFATELFEKWGIGKSDKDNGILMLVVRDKRKAVFRTGYGAEGVLPDIIAGRILREEMFPRFREGDFDGGILAGATRMTDIISDPEAAGELRSEIPSDSRRSSSGDDADSLWNFFLGFAAAIGFATLVWVVAVLIAGRKSDSLTLYRRLNSMRTLFLFTAFLTLGIGLPAFLILVWRMRKLREKPRECPNCHTRMKKLDEQTDNLYLTPAQDTEERINSIDYDVWLCPRCETTEIIPYANRHSSYTVCPRCGARACTETSNKTITPPTYTREGEGLRTFTCLNCRNTTSRTYRIPRKERPAAAAVPLGGIGGGGFRGGGFSGGSFGGGSTGGGGASGGW